MEYYVDLATASRCLFIYSYADLVSDLWLWMLFTCRKFQVGNERFLIHWLLVINRKSSEVPMIDVNLVCLALVLSHF